MNRESRVHPKARRRAVFYDSIEDVKKVNVQAFVNDIRATYSPLNIVLLCGFLASIMIMVLPIIFIGLYGLLMILIELMGDTYQVNIDMYKARTISYILTYLRNTWWLAILGWFRCSLAYLRRCPVRGMLTTMPPLISGQAGENGQHHHCGARGTYCLYRLRICPALVRLGLFDSFAGLWSSVLLDLAFLPRFVVNQTREKRKPGDGVGTSDVFARKGYLRVRIRDLQSAKARRSP